MSISEYLSLDQARTKSLRVSVMSYGVLKFAY